MMVLGVVWLTIGVIYTVVGNALGSRATEEKMSRSKYPDPPAWAAIGVAVDYHSVIGGPVTMANTRIRSEPWQLGHGEWVVLLEGKTGGVSFRALTQAIDLRE